MNRWECMTCTYIYNEQWGDILREIPRQTSFEALPTEWKCPECGSVKDSFYPEITAKALKHRH